MSNLSVKYDKHGHKYFEFEDTPIQATDEMKAYLVELSKNEDASDLFHKDNFDFEKGMYVGCPETIERRFKEYSDRKYAILEILYGLCSLKGIVWEKDELVKDVYNLGDGWDYEDGGDFDDFNYGLEIKQVFYPSIIIPSPDQPADLLENYPQNLNSPHLKISHIHGGGTAYTNLPLHPSLYEERDQIIKSLEPTIPVLKNLYQERNNTLKRLKKNLGLREQAVQKAALLNMNALILDEYKRIERETEIDIVRPTCSFRAAARRLAVAEYRLETSLKKQTGSEQSNRIIAFNNKKFEEFEAKLKWVEAGGWVYIEKYPSFDGDFKLAKD